MGEKKYLRSLDWRDYVVILFGLVVYSIGLVGFLIPNEIVTGGLSGVALLVKYASDIPVWSSTLVANFILLVIAWILLGKHFVWNTLCGAMGLSAMIGIAEQFLKPLLEPGDPLGIIIGAACCGTGLGLVYSRNSTTGGTDIVAALVTRYRYISIGRVLMLVDVLIISFSWFLFASIEKIIYGLIVAAVVYYSVDVVINGFRQSVQFFIFSLKYDEIATEINRELHRGCTVIHGVGWYSQQPQKILIVLARKTESTTIFRLVKRIDESAFISQANVSGVYGKGFEQMK